MHKSSQYLQYCSITTGTSTAYVAPLPIGATLAEGLRAMVMFHAACGANPTLNLGGLGVKDLYKPSATGPAFVKLDAGDILANHPAEVLYQASLPGYIVVSQLVPAAAGGGAASPYNPYGVATTADNLTYSVTTTPAQASFTPGDRITVKMPSANAGGMALAVNGLASVAVIKDQPLVGVAVMAANNCFATVCYDFLYIDIGGTKYWKICQHPLTPLEMPTNILANYISSGVVTNTKFDKLDTVLSYLQVHTILTKTANYNAAVEDTYIEAGHATVPVTITLLAIGASSLSGRTVIIVNTGAQNLTIAESGGGTLATLTTGQIATMIAGGAWRRAS